MPADRDETLRIGRRGVNVRDDIIALRTDELSDSINWQIGARGSLEKRLGFVPYGSTAAPAPILDAFVFRPLGATPIIMAYCTNGQVYSTTDAVTWTSRASGLSTSARPTWVQYLDVLYWSNGTDSLRSMTGAFSVTTIGSAPLGEYLAIWRNRLWIGSSEDRTVYWSKSGDPTDWTSQPYNSQAFPNFPAITSLTAAPNIGGEEAADGLLVITERSVHRIVDDTDNSSGVIVGGANELVDGGQGFVSHRTVAHDRGRVYGLGRDGVYSTNGKEALRAESSHLDPVFHRLVNYTQAEAFDSIALHGRYYLSVQPTTDDHNSLVFECYLDMPADENRQHPWMPHDIPVGTFLSVPDTTSGIDDVLFADSSSGDTARLRWLFQGGHDTDGASTEVAITARARTGGLAFGIEATKKLRRLYLIGTGLITVGVTADGEEGAGETRTFTLEISEDLWGGSDTWSGTWGPSGGSNAQPAYYTVRGRYLTFEITESSDNVSSSRRAFGLGSVQVGGAAVDAMNLTLTPLDC